MSNDNEQGDESKSIWNDFLLPVTLAAPLRRIQILLQTSGIHPKMHDKIDHMKKIPLRKALDLAGSRNFIYYYRGNFTNMYYMFMNTLLTSIAFNTIFSSSDLPRGNDKYDNYFGWTLCQIIGISFTYPIQYARTRIAADLPNFEFNSFTRCIQKLQSTTGLASLYTGYRTFLKNFLLIEFLRHGLFIGGTALLFKEKYIQEKSLIKYMTGLLLVTDMIAYFIAYPFETVNRRMILQDTRADKVYLDAKDCLRKMIKQERARSLWRGFLFGAIARMIEPKNLIFILEVIDNDK